MTPITLHGLRLTPISHLLMDVLLGVYAAHIPSMQADVALRVDAWLR